MGRKFKVLIVNQHTKDVRGGSEWQCHIIANTLLSFGHQVTYAICHPLKSNEADYQEKYTLFLIKQPFGVYFAKVLKETNPDFVYWRYNKKYLLLSVSLAKYYGVRFVFAVSHIHDVIVFSAKPFSKQQLSVPQILIKLSKKIVKQLLSGINAIAFLFIDGVVLQHKGQAIRSFKTPYRIIYNSYISPNVSNENPEEFSEKYVLWVANLKQAKNPEVYIRLANDFSQYSIKFLMIGRVEDKAYQFMIDHPQSLPSNLVFLGKRRPEQVQQYLKHCLFLVHTCDPEGFPNIFIQAWMHSKAVVSLYFDPDGLIRSHHLGAISGNYEQIKQDVKVMLENEYYRNQIGKGAYEFAKENFNANKNVSLLVKFMHDLV